MNSCVRPIALCSTLLVALMCFTCSVTVAADTGTRRKVIIDQDAFEPAGSNMQAILMLLQSKDVEVLGITIPSGDGWRDEEVSHTLRLLEIAQRRPQRRRSRNGQTAAAVLRGR